MSSSRAIDPLDIFPVAVPPKSGAPVAGRHASVLDAQQRFLAASWKYGCFVQTMAAKGSGASETILNSGDKDEWLVWVPPFTKYARLHVLANLASGKNDGSVYVQLVGTGLTGGSASHQKKIDVWSDIVGYYSTDTPASTANDVPGEHVEISSVTEKNWVLARFNVWLDDVELFGILFEPLRAVASDLLW